MVNGGHISCKTGVESMGIKNKDEINRILHETTCNKQFRCVKNDFKNMCKAQFQENEEVICLEKSDHECQYKKIEDNNIAKCTCGLRRIGLQIIYNESDI